LTHSNLGENLRDIPGYVQGALLNILEYDKEMLSEYGETLAGVLKQIRDEDNAKLQQSAKELDDLFEEE